MFKYIFFATLIQHIFNGENLNYKFETEVTRRRGKVMRR